MRAQRTKKTPNTETALHIRHFGYVRALGVTLVLLYHFYPRLLPGGFIGVDVFFTFSGYLITALALEEFRTTRDFSLRRFAERRFFRIFPTIAFSMLIVLPLTLLGNSDLRYNLSQQVFAGLGFVSNLYEASTGVSYATSFAPHLFVHLWSLAIEVQFYVVWGLIIWLLVRASRHRGISGQTFALSAVIFFASAVAMLLSAFGATDFSALYYSPLLHIFPFFLGAALAAIAGISRTAFIATSSRQRQLSHVKGSAWLSAGGLVLLAFLLQFGSRLTYMVGFLLAAILALVLIWNLRLLHEMTTTQEPAVIRFIADVSYGVYIFHWPLLIIFENIKLPHALAVLLTLVLSFALSALMFYGIDPILRGRRQPSRLTKRLLLVTGIILLIPSGIALSQTANVTTLAKSLYAGSNAQSVSQLALSERVIETGAVGAHTLIIGDSVALGTTYGYGHAQTLAKALPDAYADTAGDRTISKSLDATLKSDLAMMPDDCAIVIALGTNSTDPKKDIATLKSVIKTYSGKHHLVLVTPADWRPGGPFDSDQVAHWEQSIKGKYKNVSVADWRSDSTGHENYFDSDGTHIGDRPEGRAAWLHLVKKALAQKN